MAAPQQLLMSYGSNGAIDPFSANLWGAYGLTRLKSSYAGSAIRVRRSSDNTEQDIGFSGTALDTSSLATFVGANDGFVTKWYDQSGGANDLAQATTTKQPQISDAGAYIGQILFDGVSHVMTTANNSGTPTALTFFAAGRLRIGGTSSEFFLSRTSAQFGNLRSTGTADNYDGEVSTVTGNESYDDALTSDATVYAAVIDRSQATVATQNVLYRNGSAVTGRTPNGSTVSGSFTAAAYAAGGDNSTAFGRMAAQTLLIYETAQSSGNVASISTLILPTAPTDGLSSYTTGLWGLYSLRRQISSYAGNCLKVRRSSDNATQDIGFDATTHVLDTASMLTFVGANNGFIDTWYDQSGGAHNATQATTTKQPKIVASGALVTNNGKTCIQFDGADDCLQTGNSSATNKFSAFYKGNVEGTGTQIVIEQSAGYDSNKGCALYFNATALHVGTGQTVSYATNQYNRNIVGSVVCATFDRSAGTSAAMSNMFSGGRKLTRDADESSGALPSGNSNAAPWNIGARNNGASLPTTGDCETVVIYEAIVADADVERISRAIG